MKQLTWIPVALALVAGALMGGCNKQQAEETPQVDPAGTGSETGTAAQRGAGKTFVMIPKGVHPYYAPCYEGFQAAAKKHGAKVDYRAAKDFELSQQVETIEGVISQHPDGIAISALDDQGLVRVIEAATKAGIKVVTFDAPAPSSAQLCYIGTMNEAAGRSGAEELVKIIGTSGEVAVLQGGLDAPNLNQRFEGFKAYLAEHAPSIKIVAREDTKGKKEITANKTEGLLQAYPNLKAIFSVSAEGCPGAAPVLKGKKVVLAGFDDDPDTLAAIRSGVVSFCIAQRTFKMGWLAVERLLDAVEGKPLEKQIDTGVLVVNKDNVDSYMAEAKEEFK